MAARNESVLDRRRMRFRIGINLGDVIHDEAHIYGDGVNIAARLESLAAPGGLCISRQAFDQVDGKLDRTFRALGPQQLKNIAKPVEVYAVVLDLAERAAASPELVPNQAIHYCRTPDGVRLAYATVGEGPPLVRTAHWLSHLEYAWESSIWGHLLRHLARDHKLVHYDARGNGLSDWEVDDLSVDAWVSDLETVVNAAGVERFPLLGVSQGCAVSVAYAVRHPERVSHLILYGGFARGRKKRATSDIEREKINAMATLMRAGWGEANPIFRQMFTSLFFPGGTKEQHDSFNELQRKCTSPECAARYFDTVGDIDVTALLPAVAAPTLVMHVRGDCVNPIEAGREMAAGIPGARFVALPGSNHLFLEDEPAAQRFFEEINLFLDQ